MHTQVTRDARGRGGRGERDGLRPEWQMEPSRVSRRVKSGQVVGSIQFQNWRRDDRSTMMGEEEREAN